MSTDGNASYIEQFLVKLESFEGAIPWMYLDTVGKVTVGVGLMLPNVEEAHRLPFRVGERMATPAEVEAEFVRVQAMPAGRTSLFYRRAGAPELPKAEISALLRTVLTGFERALESSVPGFAALPDSVKMALLDMAYNLGPEGLLRGYPRMLQAVEAGDWRQAAAQCFRHGPSEARNTWTRAMFLENVLGDVTAEAESVFKRLGFGIVGACATLWESLRRGTPRE